LTEPALTTKTSQDGRFAFAHVAPGDYTLTVSTIGYIFVKRTVTVANADIDLTIHWRRARAHTGDGHGLGGLGHQAQGHRRQLAVRPGFSALADLRGRDHRRSDARDTGLAGRLDR
jgi:hypothetical protein